MFESGRLVVKRYVTSRISNDSDLMFRVETQLKIYEENESVKLPAICLISNALMKNLTSKLCVCAV